MPAPRLHTALGADDRAATLSDPDDALSLVEIRPVPYDSGHCSLPPRADAEIAEAEVFFATFDLNG